MKRNLIALLPAAALALLLIGPADPTAGQQAAPEKKFEDFDQVIKGAKEFEGLFRLYLKDDRLFAEIQPGQFNQPFLCPIAVARGLGIGGDTLNFGEQWVLMFRRVGDKVHLIRRNVHFQAKKNSAVAKAVETTYADSVLMSLRIHSVHPSRGSILINFNDIFMTDFAQLGIGGFDSSRSVWGKVKAFPRNVELEVAATYSGGFHDGSVIDSRGATVVIHYGLCQLPEDGYQPRIADDRVGHFLTVVKDFSTDSKDTTFVRYVNRWRLERADPVDPKNPNKLSAPKKKIIFWIEKSVPEEYRASVREGILEWNKAFEKIGFRDAIEVRQQESEDFDPEDINYNTFRWITTDRGFARGPSRANPLTGELMDADIVFDASMVRFYRQEALAYNGANPTAQDMEPISPIKAIRDGWGLFNGAMPSRDGLAGWDDRPNHKPDAAVARYEASQQGVCQCGSCMKRELALAALALADMDPAKDGAKPSPVVLDELIGQAVKEVTMHEVGHTLGLRHNFKASTMLKNDQLHDVNITHKQGLVGSVMDYAPVNLAPKGVKQGDYFTTTLGPYDYWAIEYAYKPLSGGTEGEADALHQIASRCATPGYDYGTDEDMGGTSDPLINVFDLGADPMQFGKDRILLAEELMKTLADRTVDKGEGYQRTRMTFGVLLQQYGNAAHLISNFVGGEYLHRDHRGDPNGRDPQEPVKGDKQREALAFLEQHLFNEGAFQFSPQLLRRLGPDRWSHWGNERAAMNRVEYPLNERVLAIQKTALDHLFDSSVLARLQNDALQADKDDRPLSVAELFRGLTDGVWNDAVVDGKDGKKTLQSSVIRRNLQREYLKDLTTLVVSPAAAPADARSLARAHLKEISGRIDKTLGDKAMAVDETTRAHLDECKERIAKALGAAMTANEP
jgi:Met-zincin/Domain of unknown function (DUF5117)